MITFAENHKGPSEELNTIARLEGRIRELEAELQHLRSLHEYKGSVRLEKMDVHQLRDLVDELRRVIMSGEGPRFPSGHPVVREMFLPGDGEFKFKDGRYKGDMVAGLPHGNGDYRGDTGNTYSGCWRYKKREGNGSAEYSNKSSYNGEWKNNKKHGVGTMVYASGLVFFGSFESDMKRGVGHLLLPDGTQEFALYGNDCQEGTLVGINAAKDIVVVANAHKGKLNGEKKIFKLEKIERWENGMLVKQA